MYTVEISKLKYIGYDDDKVRIVTKGGHELWVRRCKVFNKVSGEKWYFEQRLENSSSRKSGFNCDEDSTCEMLEQVRIACRNHSHMERV